MRRRNTCPSLTRYRASARTCGRVATAHAAALDALDLPAKRIRHIRAATVASGHFVKVHPALGTGARGQHLGLGFDVWRDACHGHTWRSSFLAELKLVPIQYCPTMAITMRTPVTICVRISPV